MHYYFTLLILVVISLANAHWGPGHRNTPEKERLNAKIKNEFHDILAITSPGGHDNLSETIDDVFKGLIREFDKFPIDESFISILNTLDGVVARDTENSAREPNLLTPLLRPPKYDQAGAYYEESAKTRDIYDFMGELANRYVEGEAGGSLYTNFTNIIHVVPIGMVVGKLDERPRENKGLYTTIFLGVLGKRNGSSNNLTGIAGIAIGIE
ncbi:hypothetical protein Ddc_16809 [Ditylenchus destructor]|nr:hypothetical protein Ddc_16809 [Ditylenchus destructor]